MATVVAAHDLSGIGRCSLTTAISVLSAMGHQCCPLPTAILSHQTAFPAYSWLDFTPYLAAYIAGWEHITLVPDMIYTGFLGSPKQPELLIAFADRHPDATLVVDPVLGDDGELYTSFDRSLIPQMRKLARRAHILTPNRTELLLLAGCDPQGPFPQDDEYLLQLICELDAPALQLVVVTGVQMPAGHCNILVEPAANRVQILPCDHTGHSYSGTGDLFTSVLCGCISSGMSWRAAVNTAAEFISTVAAAMPPDCDPRYGLFFERFLYLLPHFE